MLNDRRSHGLWEASAPPPPQTQQLTADIDTDVAVVGAGYTGLSTALHLAERGTDVTVIEATEIGFGAAGRSSGFVNAGLWVMPSALEEVLGKTHGQRLVDLLIYSPTAVYDIIEKYGIACEARRAGSIHCGAGRKGVAEINERGRQWSALGAPVRVLSREETRSMTGTGVYPAGLLDLRAGSLQPLAYVRGLGDAAISAGAKIFTGSPVHKMVRDGARWILKTPRGTVRAKWVVLSTDAYTANVAPELRDEQVILPMFHVATAPLTSSQRESILPEGHCAWDTHLVLRVFRTDDAGRLIIGSVGALRGTGTFIHRTWAKRFIRKLFPQLGEVEIQHEWHGRIGTTNDHLPRLHTPAENVVSISGYNGRGIATGTVFGREIARYVAGEVNLNGMALPLTTATDARFLGLREGYYELGAQIAHLPPIR